MSFLLKRPAAAVDPSAGVRPELPDSILAPNSLFLLFALFLVYPLELAAPELKIPGYLGGGGVEPKEGKDVSGV